MHYIDFELDIQCKLGVYNLRNMLSMFSAGIVDFLRAYVVWSDLTFI